MSSKEVRVGIAGVGSCASSLVQLVEYVKSGSELSKTGIMFDSIGGYKAEDIKFVCSFDVSDTKVGLDLSEAIFAYPNSAKKHVEVPYLNVKVHAGPLADGLDGILSTKINPHRDSELATIDDVTEILKKTKTDVLVCYLPTGAKQAVENYAIAAANANVAFINCTPELVIRNEKLNSLFKEKKIPLLGDDMRSHMGATTLHTALIELLSSRGITVNNTYQLNFGGNMDFFNLSDPSRNLSKQISKKNALYAAGIDASTVAAGPNGYVEYLQDNKVCYLRIEGSSILGSNITMETRLEVEDSPNSAGVIITAVRIAKTALDNKEFGEVIEKTCPFLFKSPVKGMTESEALSAIKDYVASKEVVFND
ncbi:myo-inositol-1-phosphate synthase [Anoxybacillus ayderensis G10]|uniref:inositol-3-phosphate synthase n=1 Tax=Saccharococcus caldoxylosilyticus TaxID=81408 RepID=UPI000305BB47|nr:myo-inositol-1-phosphate synthase [Parageobacillus caldoxylosilyticus]AXM88679.1 myo-inositol-1-phosphate synthase [Anoxybacillus ayderensis G10]QXJ40663.1 Inositol-3-phosphate synthase [Parageobacillus caldoxylosilyticus]